MDNKPLANATVVFIPQGSGGRPAGARTDADGNYVLNFTEGRQGAIPGKNTVRVTTLRDAGQDENGKTIPGSKETIPAEYNVASKLEFDVKEGEENIINIDLKSGGKVISSE